MHNNGIHRGVDWGPISFSDLTYEFRSDQDVRCASFGHILAVLDEVIDAVEQILFSHEIRDLCRIEDRYVVLNS